MILKFKTKPLSVNKLYRGRRFSTKEHVIYKEELAIYARQQWKKQPLEGDIRVKVTFNVENKRSDLDNLLKAFLDSFKGIVWKDDRQICEIQAKRIISKEHKITLEII